MKIAADPDFQKRMADNNGVPPIVYMNGCLCGKTARTIGADVAQALANILQKPTHIKAAKGYMKWDTSGRVPERRVYEDEAQTMPMSDGYRDMEATPKPTEDDGEAKDK